MPHLVLILNSKSLGGEWQVSVLQRWLFPLKPYGWGAHAKGKGCWADNPFGVYCNGSAMIAWGRGLRLLSREGKNTRRALFKNLFLFKAYIPDMNPDSLLFDLVWSVWNTPTHSPRGFAVQVIWLSLLLRARIWSLNWPRYLDLGKLTVKECLNICTSGCEGRSSLIFRCGLLRLRPKLQSLQNWKCV